MTRDYRDDCLEELARSEAALRDEVAALHSLAESRAADFAAMRLVAAQALHALHDEQRKHAKLKERHQRLLALLRTPRDSQVATSDNLGDKAAA